MPQTIKEEEEMSTQSYYKDRLGFDPKEALYEPSSSPPLQAKGGTPSRHQSHSRISVSPGRVASNNQYDQYDSPSAKKAKQSQGGYEDALTQFKGTMSMWEFFVENWDFLGM